MVLVVEIVFILAHNNTFLRTAAVTQKQPTVRIAGSFIKSETSGNMDFSPATLLLPA